ncbi:glycoside hydrolase family 5 protein [Nonomuraea purpurea]|uniref:Glycoside hydrolase family 5 protein n=1 Tax=Nonomuraea purpurea TaxID=1849276 RepID=A0ABV8G1A8_9ACTN
MRLGRGVNFGNALDARGEGEPGFRLEERYFDEVALAGFDTVRLPVRWSAHAAETPPYRIDPAFFDRVDRAVNGALRRGLNVVINVHHYDEVCAAPDQHEGRFLALWRQIAPRYADHSEPLCFELLNEPRDPMTPERWNGLAAKALAVVRESNPDRTVLIGPARMNDIDALAQLDLPQDDHLMATVHYYAPFAFTHQGAGWVKGADAWLGTRWGDDADRATVRRDLTTAAAWASEHGLPLFLGEFGTFSKAHAASRVEWTAFVRSEAERLGMSWAYWDFGTDFGVFNPDLNSWREPLRQALIPGHLRPLVSER